MFTCIIPTLWKSNRTVKLVNDLCACESVGEVIIIDNEPNLPNFSTTSLHRVQVQQQTKVKIVKMERNIYVNPAWNMGVDLATYEDISLINDDVNFNADVFKLFDDGSLVNKGVIGMDSANYKLLEDKTFSLETGRPKITLGWGCIIFVNKKNYIPIPDDLLIWCGDNWLSTRLPFSVLMGLKVTTEMSTSCRHFNKVTVEDRKTYNLKYAQGKKA